MKLLPLVVPWLLAPALFSLVVASVRAWTTESLQIAILFVVFPLAIWIAVVRSCKEKLQDPVFAPSFITAVVFTDTITNFLVLRPAISTGLEVALGIATVSLLLLYWRAITSDPGRFPILADSNIAWVGGHESASNLHLPRNTQLKQWDAANFEGVSPYLQEPSDVRDAEAGKGGFRQVSILESDGEDGGGVPVAAEEYSPKRLPTRARYCRKCNAWIDHYDHHCPALMNCVGRKNHVLFLGALLAFIVAEFLYIHCSNLYLQVVQQLWSPATDGPSTMPIGLQDVEHAWNVICQVMTEEPWVASTAAFAALQASWQIPLLLFHLYCASVNLTTNEWIKWEHYPNLYIDLPPGPDRLSGGKKFVNPYDHGVVMNLKHFFQSRV